MSKLLAALLTVTTLAMSANVMAYCGTYDGWNSSHCDVPLTPPGATQQPSMKYDIYRNGNNTTYQPKETYKGQYGYDLERYGKPITCTTIGNNTYCN
jgi:hypothetical protein